MSRYSRLYFPLFTNRHLKQHHHTQHVLLNWMQAMHLKQQINLIHSVFKTSINQCLSQVFNQQASHHNFKAICFYRCEVKWSVGTRDFLVSSCNKVLMRDYPDRSAFCDWNKCFNSTVFQYTERSHHFCYRWAQMCAEEPIWIKLPRQMWETKELM